VIVTDGFTGNVALKTMEGFATFLLGNLREVFESGLLRKIAYLLIRKKLSALRSKLDPSEYGGAPLLGVAGPVIIAHGSSTAHAIRNAIRAAANEALIHHVNREIVEMVARLPGAGAIKPGSQNKGIRGLFLKMRDRLHRPHQGRDQHEPRAARDGTGELARLEREEVPAAPRVAEPVAETKARRPTTPLDAPVPSGNGVVHEMSQEGPLDNDPSEDQPAAEEAVTTPPKPPSA
jgi:hypothetical protein